MNLNGRVHLSNDHKQYLVLKKIPKEITYLDVIKSNFNFLMKRRKDIPNTDLPIQTTQNLPFPSFLSLINQSDGSLQLSNKSDCSDGKNLKQKKKEKKMKPIPPKNHRMYPKSTRFQKSFR